MKQLSRPGSLGSARERKGSKPSSSSRKNTPATKRGANEASKEELNAEIEAQQNQLSEVDREWFHIRIRDLEAKLERAKQENKAVRDEAVAIRDQLSQALEDKNDIAQFFQRSLQNRQDQILELEERLAGLRKTREAEKQCYESQISELKANYASLDQQLTSENKLLQGKLTSLEEFRLQQEELNQRFASLEQQLRDKDEIHREATEELERQSILRMQDLKEEHEDRIKVLSKELEKVAFSKLSVTSRKALEENSTLLAQIQTLAKRVVCLTAETDAARRKIQGTQVLVHHLEKQLENSEVQLKHLKKVHNKVNREKDTLQRELSNIKHQMKRHSNISEEFDQCKQELTELTITATEQEKEISFLRQSERKWVQLLDETQRVRAKHVAFISQAKTVLESLLQETSGFTKNSVVMKSILELLAMEDVLSVPSPNSHQEYKRSFLKLKSEVNQYVTVTIAMTGILEQMKDNWACFRKKKNNATIGLTSL